MKDVWWRKQKRNEFLVGKAKVKAAYTEGLVRCSLPCIVYSRRKTALVISMILPVHTPQRRGDARKDPCNDCRCKN